MGAIDKSVKAYLKIPGIFAQLFNERFFEREYFVDPAHLQEQDSVLDVSLVRGDSSKEKRESMERLRDVCMMAESGMGFRIILGVEEQTDIHYYMPVRVMLMDAIHYEAQCKKKAAEAREQGEKFIPVQGVPQGTVILPVMTVVLYLGEKEWDGPRTLYDMFDLPEKEKEICKRRVADYPIHLIDARHMTDEEVECFTDDLKIFFTALRDNYDENRIRKAVAKYPDTWYTLAIIKNDKRYIEHMKLLEESKRDKGGISVDATLDRIENRGFQKGMSQGISQGIIQGIELSARLMKEGKTEEMKHALEDKDYLKELLGAYDIVTGEND